MAQQRLERVVFVSDRPSRLFRAGQETAGPPLSAHQLQAMVEEYLSPAQQLEWKQSGHIQFPCRSGQSTYNVSAQQSEVGLQVSILPVAPQYTTPVPAAQVAATRHEAIPHTATRHEAIPHTATPHEATPHSATATHPVNAVQPLAGKVAEESHSSESGSDSIASTSGRGEGSILPSELRGFNWGAFLCSWMWAIPHRSRWGFFGLIPYLGWFIAGVILGIKGNEEAWKNRRWDSIEVFKAVQKQWMMAGAGLWVVGGVLTVVSGVIWFQRVEQETQLSTSRNNLRMLSLGIRLYSQDTLVEEFPPMDNAEAFKNALYPKYIKEERHFLQPATGKMYLLNPKLSGVSMMTLEKPEEIVMLYEATPHADGSRYVAFANIRPQWIHADEAEMASARQTELEQQVSLKSAQEWPGVKQSSGLP